MDRRDFVKLTATGLLVLFAVDPASAGQETARAAGGAAGLSHRRQRLPPHRRGRQGHLLRREGRTGAGRQTSLPQLLADDLDVALSSVSIVMGDTDLCPWDMGTFGSLSIRQFGPVLRQAAADARAVLLELASERLQVPVERLARESGRRDRYRRSEEDGDLRPADGGKRIERKVDGKTPLKAVRAFAVVGQSARSAATASRR